MSRPIVLGVAAVLLFALGFLAANTHVARGVIFPVTAYEADVNKDTRVNVADLGLVASKYGQTAPTATPVPVATATPTSYCDLSGRTIGNDSDNPQVTFIDFSNCRLINTNWTDNFTSGLIASNFNSADLSYASLDNTNVSLSDFTNANLTGATLRNMTFQQAKFRFAILTDAILTNSTFNPPYAMYQADFYGATTTGADTTGVTWFNTTCPDGTNSDDDGGSCVGHGFDGAPLPTYTPSPPCTGGAANAYWTAGNGHCFERYDVPRNFADAQTKCVSRGGYLVTLTSAEETAFVYPTVGTLGGWIGLTDEVTEGVFLWVSGEPVAYTSWYPGEPSGGTSQNAVVFTGDDVWDDREASRLLQFVCEIP